MGAPIRSNIFRSGSDEQQYFAGFPVQVAVLFSPTDDVFVRAFSELFVELDRITGDKVVFFALLDPPAEWIEIAGQRSWWRNYNRRNASMGFSYNDRPLVQELARQFGVAWSEFPALVISTNLWTSEFFVAPTSAQHIEQQLTLLTELVDEWGQPTFGQMIAHLQDSLGVETRYAAPSEQRRIRLSSIYNFMSTYEPELRRLDMQRYGRSLDRELQQIHLDRPRRGRERRDDTSNLQSANLSEYDMFAEDSAGRLIAPATVALRAFAQLNDRRDFRLTDWMDEESLVMIETALTIGTMLEGLEDHRLPLQQPLRFARQPWHGAANAQDNGIDFTPSAQGVWKAFEREINLSVIQAARCSRGICMPDYFALFDENFPDERASVPAGKYKKNLNVRDTRNAHRHEFFELGVARYIVTGMLENPNETLGHEIEKHLGHQLPGKVLDDWESIRRIRNEGSHSALLSRAEYEQMLGTALDPALLVPLVQVKRGLMA